MTTIASHLTRYISSEHSHHFKGSIYTPVHTLRIGVSEVDSSMFFGRKGHRKNLFSHFRFVRHLTRRVGTSLRAYHHHTLGVTLGLLVLSRRTQDQTTVTTTRSSVLRAKVFSYIPISVTIIFKGIGSRRDSHVWTTIPVRHMFRTLSRLFTNGNNPIFIVRGTFSISHLPSNVPVFRVHFFTMGFIFNVVVHHHYLAMNVPILTMRLITIFVFRWNLYVTTICLFLHRLRNTSSTLCITTILHSHFSLHFSNFCTFCHSLVVRQSGLFSKGSFPTGKLIHYVIQQCHCEGKGDLSSLGHYET